MRHKTSPLPFNTTIALRGNEMKEESKIRNKYIYFLIAFSLLFLLLFYFIGVITTYFFIDFTPTFQSNYFWDFMGKVQIVVFLILILICLPILLIHQLFAKEHGQSLTPMDISISNNGILLYFGKKRTALIEWADILDIEENKSLYFIRLRNSKLLKVKLKYRLIQNNDTYIKEIRKKGDLIEIIISNSDWNEKIERDNRNEITKKISYD